MNTDSIKANGIHYTPPELAQFLAEATVRRLPRSVGTIRVLDPACGDGALLRAVVEATPAPARPRLALTGFETDPAAVAHVRCLLAEGPAADVKEVHIERQDFLLLDDVAAQAAAERPPSHTQNLKDTQHEHTARYDAVIANPPYVRTQVLGGPQARELARRFGLTGRVDLYQAFTKAMAHVLKPGGVLGLLTSNRFLTVKAGEALRRLLRTEFDLQAVYDLGDTRLFTAAVLPVIVIATKRQEASGQGSGAGGQGSRLRGRESEEASIIEHACSFQRVYAHNPNAAGDTTEYAPEYATVLQALADSTRQGVVRTGAGHYRIERGVLAAANPEAVWTLSTPEYDDWLQTVRRHQQCTFGDVAHIRVGIKTTADEVFVRTDWNQLPPQQRPEAHLLYRLITHHDAGRWTPRWSNHDRQVLYPHTVSAGKRTAIDLDDYPQAAAYLQARAERLKRRKYVVESGRRWYEIWVPHHPGDWPLPKIVFPDISETPKFFLDDSGAIVQGDCYWMTARPGVDPDWLLLMLAVANSAFSTRFYDLVFHNKLYAGRRRFMTQYVKQFPLPPLSAQPVTEIVGITRRLVQGEPPTAAIEAKLEELVQQAFGLES